MVTEIELVKLAISGGVGILATVAMIFLIWFMRGLGVGLLAALNSVSANINSSTDSLDKLRNCVDEHVEESTAAHQRLETADAAHASQLQALQNSVNNLPEALRAAVLPDFERVISKIADLSRLADNMNTGVEGALSELMVISEKLQIQAAEGSAESEDVSPETEAAASAERSIDPVDPAAVSADESSHPATRE